MIATMVHIAWCLLICLPGDVLYPFFSSFPYLLSSDDLHFFISLFDAFGNSFDYFFIYVMGAALEIEGCSVTAPGASFYTAFL